MEKRTRTNSLINVTQMSFRLLKLINDKKTIKESREIMNQSSQSQNGILTTLLNAYFIERVGRANYKLTNNGKWYLSKFSDRLTPNNDKASNVQEEKDGLD